MASGKHSNFLPFSVSSLDDVSNLIMSSRGMQIVQIELNVVICVKV